MLACGAFSPDGSLLATASSDATARLWDVASGAERSVLRGHGDSLAWCAFSPDGAVLATASFDRTVRIWDVASGAELWSSPGTRSGYAGWRSNIFDELGQPEPDGGVDVTPAQTARLWQELAANSALQERLRRAEANVSQLERYRRRLFLLALVGGAVADERTVAELNGARADVGALRVPWFSWLVVLLPLLAIMALVAWAIGFDHVWQYAATVAVALAATRAAIAPVSALLAGRIRAAGRTARTDEVRQRRAEVDSQLETARGRERELREEIADIAAGRGLARLLAERGRDYRGELGLVSRIREDFEQLAELLKNAAGRTDPETPPVERIVLYIDDLDRCPPKRVVEVLEAVHLILALELFVVVVAVDPRWLLQSLRLHYSQLLASSAGADVDGDADGGAWQSTPVHYLEKIIQVPFTLRPLTTAGVEKLVGSLLPAEAPAGEPATETAAAGPTPSGAETPAAPSATTPVPENGRRQAAAAERPRPLDLSPQNLSITDPEREFAARVARLLDTPRAVKKFTNLYRLVRARLDEESGELDRFLETDEAEIPEYEAVLLILGLLVAFPDEAAGFLLGLGDLTPAAAPDRRPWLGYLTTLRGEATAGRQAALLRYLGSVGLTNAGTSTREPFRRWALELSRYSFETGQEVFARFSSAAVGPR